MNINIKILMTTYNGELFIKEQLDSILSQTYSNWNLIIGDDGSTDGTIQIINEYMQKDSRIKLKQNVDNLGVVKNFENLLKITNGEYYMFCDQDDVWLLDKIDKTMECMLEVESVSDVNESIYVFSDIVQVNKNLEPLGKKYNKNLPYAINLNRLLLKSVIPGCVSMINNSLKKKVLPFPSEIILHDYWMSLVAASMGTLKFLPIKLLKYRHHGSNITAGKKRSTFKRISDTLNKVFLKDKDISPFLLRERMQARLLLQEFEGELTDSQFKIIESFANIEKYGFIKRKYIQLRYGFFRNTFYDNLELFLRI